MTYVCICRILYILKSFNKSVGFTFNCQQQSVFFTIIYKVALECQFCCWTDLQITLHLIIVEWQMFHWQLLKVFHHFLMFKWARYTLKNPFLTWRKSLLIFYFALKYFSFIIWVFNFFWYFGGVVATEYKNTPNKLLFL